MNNGGGTIFGRHKYLIFLVMGIAMLIMLNLVVNYEKIILYRIQCVNIKINQVNSQTRDAFPPLSMKDKKAAFEIVRSAMVGKRPRKYLSPTLDSYNLWVAVSFYQDKTLLARKKAVRDNIADSIEAATAEIVNNTDVRGVTYNNLDIDIDLFGYFEYQREKSEEALAARFRKGMTGVFVKKGNAVGFALPNIKVPATATVVDFLKIACKEGEFKEDDWTKPGYSVFFFRTVTIRKKSYTNQIQ
jgi:hypothetical protein